jgi:hypothetical protein
MSDDEDYASKYECLENQVRTMDGKIVIDSLTGKPLVKFRTGLKRKINMNNPDEALEKLMKLNKGVYTITCSKCHHCR